jgi:hypothetical protein
MSELDQIKNINIIIQSALVSKSELVSNSKSELVSKSEPEYIKFILKRPAKMLPNPNKIKN